MTAHLVGSLAEACRALASDPGAAVLAGGTDVMVELHDRAERPSSFVALNQIPELVRWHREGEWVHLGSCLTLADLSGEPLAALIPGLAQAASTIGTPQVRNMGTLGGNVANAAPTSDLLPMLLAQGAIVHLRRDGGARSVPIDAFVLGPHRTARHPSELIEAIAVPVSTGGQQFLKVGHRTAVAVALASVALTLDDVAEWVTIGVGALGPRPVRLGTVERWLGGALDWTAPTVSDHVLAQLQSSVSEAVPATTDHRASEGYRRHAAGVLARRALASAWR